MLAQRAQAPAGSDAMIPGHVVRRSTAPAHPSGPQALQPDRAGPAGPADRLQQRAGDHPGRPAPRTSPSTAAAAPRKAVASAAGTTAGTTADTVTRTGTSTAPAGLAADPARARC
jgi:hypothetical protein